MLTKEDLNAIRQIVNEEVRNEVSVRVKDQIRTEVPPIIEGIVRHEIRENNKLIFRVMTRKIKESERIVVNYIADVEQRHHERLTRLEEHMGQRPVHAI